VAVVMWVFVPVLRLVSVRVLRPCNTQERCASNESRPKGHDKTGVDCVITDVRVHRGGHKYVDHGSGMAALDECMYWRVSRACFVRRKMVNKLGLCLVTNGERSLNSLKDLRV